MPYQISIAAHIVIGTVAILLFWGAFLAVKGSPRHRLSGKGFFVMLLVVVTSVGPILLFRPGPFDPSIVVQFVYLALCTVAVVMVGWTAIAWKSDLARFRGRHFKTLGVTIFVLGLVVLTAGIAKSDPVPMVFSLIGLVYGGAMMRFAWMKAAPHPRWPLAWHLNAVSGLFNAAHGTFLALAWRHLVDPAAGDGTTIVFQLGTMAAGLAMRLWFGRRRNAPMRLSRAPASFEPQRQTIGQPAA